MKPNLKVAVPGTIAFVGCVAFMGWMKYSADEAVREGTHYVQYDQEGKAYMGKTTKSSKWDWPASIAANSSKYGFSKITYKWNVEKSVILKRII